MSLRKAIKKLFKPTKIKMVGIVAFLVLSTGISASVFSTASAACYGDNNANAVIRCGAPSMSALSADYTKNTQDINQVYASSPFNMDKTSFNAFESNYVMGDVYKNGDIYVNNTLVATGALTAGHDLTKSCGDQTANGAGVFVRPPVCSFKSSPLEAFVYMPDSQFRFAVILSCGNPVVGTPVTHPTPQTVPKVPNYTIVKLVRNPGDADYVHTVATKAGYDVQYKITITSTGNAPVENLHVGDSLSSNITYIAGSLHDDGRTMIPSDAANFFDSTKGVIIPSLAPGAQRIFTFSAIVGKGETYATCTPANGLTNVGVEWATGLPAQNSKAYVNKTCPTPPANSLECDSLVAMDGGVNSDGTILYNFTAKATPTYMTITKYVFSYGDGSADYTVTTSADSTTATHNYAVGTYTASVTVYGQNGKTQTSANCTANVTASTSPVCTSPNGGTYPEGSSECNTTTTTTTTTPTGGTTTLPNTGPGNVVAIVVGATGLGALGHWFYLLRKAKRALLK